MATEYNYSRQFGFEKSFDPQVFLEWIKENWTLAFWYSGLYVFLIFSGQYYMEKRPRFELRRPLAVWSGLLAVFSLFGAVRTIPELFDAVKDHGFDYSVCSPSYFYGATAFWAYMFTISKVYELGDTAFIVLRKQPLIFLHWYHHITVMCYSWYSYTDHTAPGRWFMVMNYTIHSFMYTYYTLRALRFNIPKWVNICITAMQISQMFVGLVINLRSYYIKSQGRYCQQSYDNLKWSFTMYFSYFILFLYFFYQNYVLKGKKAVAVQQKGDSCTQNGMTHLTKKVQ